MRTAIARTWPPTATTTVISSTPLAGDVTITRLTRGRWPAHSIGPSWPIRRRVCCVVHGTIWLAGLDPASVSASTWANLLGHPPGAGSWSGCSPPEPDAGRDSADRIARGAVVG